MYIWMVLKNSITATPKFVLAYSACVEYVNFKGQYSTTIYYVTLQFLICVSEIIIVFIIAVALVITAAIITLGIVFLKRFAEGQSL